MAGKKKSDFALNVGTSSLLFIFVILCLISFAILSLSSSMSDYKLSGRIAENTTEYYEACNRAEEMLASLDEALAASYESGISRAGYFDAVGKKKNFSIPVTDIQTLQIEVDILYPQYKGDPFYKVSSWKLETTGSLEYDETLPVFK